jgi:hypothetical protein
VAEVSKAEFHDAMLPGDGATARFTETAAGLRLSIVGPQAEGD